MAKSIIRYRRSRPKKKSHRRNGGVHFPIAIVAGMAPGLTWVWRGLRDGGPEMAGVMASRVYLGYDPSTNVFQMQMMKSGTGPLILGIIVHKIANRLGINKAIAGSGIPFIRI